MTLSEMKALLAAQDIRLTKSLGQNFLHDRNQLRRIIDAAALDHTDRVLEIGPGLGPLTEELLPHVREVLAIEKDLRLVEQLQTRLGHHPGLRLIPADAMDYIRGQHLDWSDWKVVSNLPYSVASPLLVELAQIGKAPNRMVVTLQLEVARRLAAAADSEDYGILTLLIQVVYDPIGSFKIPASCFFPEPDVDSACVTLVRRDPPLLTPEEQKVFARVVKQGFSQRRKMMLKLLKANWPGARIEEAFTAIGIDPQTRAEHVALPEFCQLAIRLAEP